MYERMYFKEQVHALRKNEILLFLDLRDLAEDGYCHFFDPINRLTASTDREVIEFYAEDSDCCFILRGKNA